MKYAGEQAKNSDGIKAKNNVRETASEKLQCWKVYGEDVPGGPVVGIPASAGGQKAVCLRSGSLHALGLCSKRGHCS